MNSIRKALVLLVLALATVMAQAQVSEERIRALLPGVWRVDYTRQGTAYYGTSTYSPDGQASYDVTVTGHALKVVFKVKARWFVEGDKLITEITHSMAPDMLPVGTIEQDTVLSIDEHTLVYADVEGVRFTERRLGPATP